MREKVHKQPVKELKIYSRFFARDAWRHMSARLRTFARNFCNIDFFLKILPLKDHELARSEM